MTTIDIYSDYVCPYCMLAETVIDEIAGDRTDVEIRWRPFELRRYPAPTLRPEDDYLPAVWSRSVYPMARRLGVDITLPTISPQPWTHTAFEGFHYADERGVGNPYTTAVFRSFFREDRDIGDIGVLTGIAAGLGLDTADFRDALEQRRYRDTHARAITHAVDDIEVTVVPTILIGNRRFSGVPDPADLHRAIDAAARPLP
ncbi:DsbA family protein [Nocardia sp. BMG111209]|uniref:DsbA family oxidoreductase n=1 Tax=Nocardia sp. BMG111209 TaxID=1160137 RepID=UPI00037B0C0E|nr:DsbA family protein [Nocardia sp. BMG111209]